MTSRRKATAGFWITVALGAVLVGYPLSFGPACWISSRTAFGAELVSMVYGPLARTFPDPALDEEQRDARLFGRALMWYTLIGTDGSWDWWFTSPDPSRETEWSWGQKPDPVFVTPPPP